MDFWFWPREKWNESQKMKDRGGRGEGKKEGNACRQTLRFWKSAFASERSAWLAQLVEQYWHVSIKGLFHTERSCVVRDTHLRASLHGGGGPQIGEVTCGGSPTYHVNVVKLKWEIIWTGGLPYLSGLPHLTGVSHLHVNRPLISCGCCLFWSVSSLFTDPLFSLQSPSSAGDKI